MISPIKQTVGILGLGQMGGSLAWTLKQKRAAQAVIGYDIKKNLMTMAMQKRIIDSPAVSVSELINKSQIVVMALPINAILKTLSRHSSILKSKKLVIDLASIRTPIHRLSSQIRLANHVGAHPICGRELRGHSAWDPNLYAGAEIFLFVEKYTLPGSIRLAKRLVKLCGGRQVALDYRKHDLLFAATSGLPHVMAFSLLRLWQQSKLKHPSLLGPSFKSATRVSSGDPEMISQLLYLNRANLIKAIARLTNILNKFKDVLSDGDLKELEKMLNRYGKKS